MYLRIRGLNPGLLRCTPWKSVLLATRIHRKKLATFPCPAGNVANLFYSVHLIRNRKLRQLTFYISYGCIRSQTKTSCDSECFYLQSSRLCFERKFRRNSNSAGSKCGQIRRREGGGAMDLNSWPLSPVSVSWRKYWQKYARWPLW